MEVDSIFIHFKISRISSHESFHSFGFHTQLLIGNLPIFLGNEPILSLLCLFFILKILKTITIRSKYSKDSWPNKYMLANLFFISNPKNSYSSIHRSSITHYCINERPGYINLNLRILDDVTFHDSDFIYYKYITLTRSSLKEFNNHWEKFTLRRKNILNLKFKVMTNWSILFIDLEKLFSLTGSVWSRVK